MDEDSALKIGGYRFSGKNLIVIGLILVGLFFAYVLFIKPKPAATTTTTATDTSGGTSSGGTSSGGGGGGDASALGSLQSSIESLQQTEAAQNAQLTSIGKNADSAARDAAGARTDASVALNDINSLLSRGNTSVTPKPAPKPGSPPPTPVAAPKPGTIAGKGSSVGSATWHITAAGLGLN